METNDDFYDYISNEVYQLIHSFSDISLIDKQALHLKLLPIFMIAIQKSREKTIDEVEDMILSDWSKEKILKKLEELKSKRSEE